MSNLNEQIVNISKAAAYDIVSKQVQELKEENKAMAESLTNLIGLYNSDDDAMAIEFIKQAKQVLKNRKPYNL